MRSNYFGIKNWQYVLLIGVLAVIAYHIGAAFK